MQPIDHVHGRAIPFGRKNVDTDVIIPAHWLKTVTREGLGRGAFEAVRKEPGNVFEDAEYAGAPILIAGDNFGCGSSREHAAWALLDMGVTCVIAPSFSDIFSGNAFKNGILAVVLPQEQVDRLLEAAAVEPDIEKRAAFFKEFQAVVAKDLPVINLVAPIQPVVGSVDHVAASSGFQAGDRIIAVGGRAVDAWTTALGALMSAGIDRRDVVVDVVDAGGSAHQRTLALSKLPADVDERQLPVEIGLAPPRQPIPPVIGSVPADGAAAKAGLAPGDRILSIGGDAIKDWRDVPDAIQKHASAGHALDITVERDGAMRSFAVTPAQGDPDPADAAAKPRWLVGIGVQPVEPNFDATLRYGPVAALGKAFSETWNQTHDLLGLLGRMVTGQASVKNLGGVISIAQAADSNAKGGLVWFLTFLAAISLSLAVLNLLPIPILDGGGLLYYLIESIKGSPLSDRVQIAGQYVGLVLLVGLMGLALYNDILRNVS